MVGPCGLEPQTSTVSRWRSSQLSYGPIVLGCIGLDSFSGSREISSGDRFETDWEAEKFSSRATASILAEFGECAYRAVIVILACPRRCCTVMRSTPASIRRQVFTLVRQSGTRALGPDRTSAPRTSPFQFYAKDHNSLSVFKAGSKRVPHVLEIHDCRLFVLSLCFSLIEFPRLAINAETPFDVSLDARPGEIKSEGIARQLYDLLIRCGKIEFRSVHSTRALDDHLTGLKMNAILLGIVDDRAPEFIIRARFRQSDVSPDLRRKVVQIFLELNFSEFACRQLPA
jgi:hypothetical protein